MSTFDLQPTPPSAPSVQAPGPGRYGQLTFTSYDGSGGAGWQVKDVQGLARPEVDLLRAGIDAQLDAGMELPRFPSPAELERFPRRLVFDALADRDPAHRNPAHPNPGGAAAWWHHAPAGLDGSGRPGNVFAHVLLDRGAGAGRETDRPIDRWRSADWLTPYGPEAVRDSVLAPREPRPGGVMSIERVVAFLLDFDDYRRLSVLRVLLDAVAAALAGGRPVVLTTADSDKAALWIAAVSYLTSPATARLLSFSTLERPGSLTNRLQQGIHLCCTPSGDHDRLAERDRGYVLIADDRDLSTGDLSTGDLGGEPHRTAAGDSVLATEWSALARVVLTDEPTAAMAFEQIVRIGLGAPAVPLLPAWPLAMVVAGASELFADGVPAARRVLPSTPDGADRAQLQTARAFIERPDLSVDEAWEMLRATSRPGEPLGPMAEQVLGIYLTLVVGDIDRLASPGGPALPEASWDSQRWIADPVIDAVRAALTDLGSRPEDRRAPAALLGLGILAWRVGLLDRIAGDLADQVERVVWPVLDSRSGRELVTSVGTVPEPVIAAVVRSGLPDFVRHRELGAALDPVVLSWPDPDGAPGDRVDLYDRLRMEFAYQSWFGSPEHHRDQRVPALAAALSQWRATGRGRDPDELARTFAESPWTVEELTAVESLAPGVLPSSFFGPAVKSARVDPVFDRLVDDLGQRRLRDFFTPYGIGDLAELRRASQHRWWLERDLYSTVERLLAGGVAGLAYPEAAFDADTATTLQLAMLIAVTLGSNLDDVEKLVQADPSLTARARPGVRTALDDCTSRGVSLSHVAAAAMLGDPRFPAPALSRKAYRWAVRVTVDDAGDRVPVLRACLAAAPTRNPDVSVERLDGPVRKRIDALFDQRTGWAGYEATMRFVPSWLKGVLPGDGWFGRRR